MKVKVGIVGGAGYTGGELLRILIHHPQAEIVFVHSKSNAGNYIHAVHTDLLGDTTLRFTDQLTEPIDVLFLCVGHGDARKFLSATTIPETVKIIDLSQDFRLQQKAVLNNRTFVYGLPEMNATTIKTAANIANPGCFATCIQLALLPLAANNLLTNDIHISAITGSTGAGQALSATSHFTWRNNNLSTYKVLDHQHLNEIGESLLHLQPAFNAAIHFIPYRGNFTRGIMATVYSDIYVDLQHAFELFEHYYKTHPFVHISKTPIDLKQVVNTNKCLLHIEKKGSQLVISSIIDNLLKGASGQAVENMNLLFGLDQTMGLRLKAAAF